jgi:hypothetical protein
LHQAAHNPPYRLQMLLLFCTQEQRTYEELRRVLLRAPGGAKHAAHLQGIWGCYQDARRNTEAMAFRGHRLLDQVRCSGVRPTGWAHCVTHTHLSHYVRQGTQCGCMHGRLRWCLKILRFLSMQCAVCLGETGEIHMERYAVLTWPDLHCTALLLCWSGVHRVQQLQARG